MQNTKYSTRQDVRFTCNRDQTIGAYMLMEGESLRAVSNGMGMFYLYASWGEGALGLYTAATINDLAGREVVQ